MILTMYLYSCVDQLESLSNMSPSLLASVGVLVMSSSDVGWQLMLVQWLERRPEVDKDLLTGKIQNQNNKLINYVNEKRQNKKKRIIIVSLFRKYHVYAFIHLNRSIKSPIKFKLVFFLFKFVFFSLLKDSDQW